MQFSTGASRHQHSPFVSTLHIPPGTLALHSEEVCVVTELPPLVVIGVVTETTLDVEAVTAPKKIKSISSLKLDNGN